VHRVSLSRKRGRGEAPPPAPRTVRIPRLVLRWACVGSSLASWPYLTTNKILTVTILSVLELAMILLEENYPTKRASASSSSLCYQLPRTISSLFGTSRSLGGDFFNLRAQSAQPSTGRSIGLTS
jgi:hypothetical protein